MRQIEQLNTAFLDEVEELYKSIAFAQALREGKSPIEAEAATHYEPEQ